MTAAARATARTGFAPPSPECPCVGCAELDEGEERVVTRRANMATMDKERCISMPPRRSLGRSISGRGAVRSSSRPHTTLGTMPGPTVVSAIATSMSAIGPHWLRFVTRPSRIGLKIPKAQQASMTIERIVCMVFTDHQSGATSLLRPRGGRRPAPLRRVRSADTRRGCSGGGGTPRRSPPIRAR